MTNQSTIDKLIEMRLTAMADAFRIQMDDPAMKEVPFEDRFGMLVDVEYSNRKNNRLKRLIRQAEFEQPDASIAAIDYHSGRKLNKALIIDEWLLLKLTEAEARNLFELIHKRRKKSSTIFCSQFRESEWYQQICDGESTLADAIMDRISYDSYKIDIENVDPSKDLSMREVYGLDPAMAK